MIAGEVLRDMAVRPHQEHDRTVLAQPRTVVDNHRYAYAAHHAQDER
jgi:hypothetical protein